MPSARLTTSTALFLTLLFAVDAHSQWQTVLPTPAQQPYGPVWGQYTPAKVYHAQRNGNVRRTTSIQNSYNRSYKFAPAQPQWNLGQKIQQQFAPVTPTNPIASQQDVWPTGKSAAQPPISWPTDQLAAQPPIVWPTDPMATQPPVVWNSPTIDSPQVEALQPPTEIVPEYEMAEQSTTTEPPVVASTIPTEPPVIAQSTIPVEPPDVAQSTIPAEPTVIEQPTIPYESPVVTTDESFAMNEVPSFSTESTPSGGTVTVSYTHLTLPTKA